MFMSTARQVSVLRPAEDEDRSAWIDGVLEQAGVFRAPAEARGSRAEVG